MQCVKVANMERVRSLKVKNQEVKKKQVIYFLLDSLNMMKSMLIYNAYSFILEKHGTSKASRKDNRSVKYQNQMEESKSASDLDSQDDDDSVSHEEVKGQSNF